LADESQEIFKGKIVEIFQKVRKFFRNRGKSETGGKCIMVSGGIDAPADSIVTRNQHYDVITIDIRLRPSK